MRIKEVLISETEIQDGITRAAQWINENYVGKKPLVLGILKGCIPFFGAVLPKLTVTCTTAFLTVSSFKGGVSAQTEPEIIDTSTDDFTNQDVIILEDIIDTARSLVKVIEWLKNKGARTVKIVTLLDKPAGRLVSLNADFSCFTIPNLFVVGFGLDYQEELRNLPYIGIMGDD